MELGFSSFFQLIAKGHTMFVDLNRFRSEFGQTTQSSAIKLRMGKMGICGLMDHFSKNPGESFYNQMAQNGRS